MVQIKDSLVIEDWKPFVFHMSDDVSGNDVIHQSNIQDSLPVYFGDFENNLGHCLWKILQSAQSRLAGVLDRPYQ